MHHHVAQGDEFKGEELQIIWEQITRSLILTIKGIAVLEICLINQVYLYLKTKPQLALALGRC